MISNKRLNIHHVATGTIIALWGIGFGLPGNFHIGIAGIGLGEILLLIYLPILFCDKSFALKFSKTIYKLRVFFNVAAIFLTAFAIGTLTGTLIFEPNPRDIVIFLRQIFYLYLLVPVLATLSTEATINFYLKSFLTGVLIICLVNIMATYDGEFEFFDALPGQNSLGNQIGIIVPFVLYQLLKTNSGTRKTVLNGIILFILVFSALLTWSKGAWIVVLMSFFLMMWMAVANKNLNKYVSKRSLLFLIIVVLAIAIPSFSFISRVVEVEISASDGSDSNDQRLASALSGIAIGLIYPFGIGGAKYSLGAARLDMEIPWIMPDPHNTYAHVLSWAGVVGLGFFLFLFFYPFWLVLSFRKSLGGYFLIYVSMLIAIYINSNFGGEFLTQPASWAIFALIIGHILSIGKNRENSNKFSDDTPIERGIGLKEGAER
jgi:hypothetical protein